MMRKQAKKYLDGADDKVVRMVYAMLETDAQQDLWDDKEFVTEIERRTTEMQSGKVKGYTWEEVKQHALRSVKNKKRK